MLSSVPGLIDSETRQGSVNDGIDLGLTLAVSISLMGLVLAILVLMFVAVTVILVRAKSKVQKELKRTKTNALYDEIGIPLSIIDSKKNIAYVSTVKP